MRAVVAVVMLAGCPRGSSCGPISDVPIEDGLYGQVESTTGGGTTPFASGAADGAEMHVAHDEVTVTYIDAEGREVVATYRVVESSLDP